MTASGKMMRIPRVILQINTAGEYGRSLLFGIAKYAHLHGPWEFYKELYTAGSVGNLSQLKEWGLDGIISLDTEDIHEIRWWGLPCVVISGYQSQEAFAGLSLVVTQDDKIGEMAAEYFLEKGYSNFGFCGVDELQWSLRRRDAFAARLAQKGHPTFFYTRPQSQLMSSWQHESRVMADWLQALPKPAAVLACNDERGQQVLEACKIAGVTVPEQIAVLGVDNDPLTCMLSNPPLSSIAITTVNAGYEAAELLDKLLADPQRPPQIIPVRPVRVITRQSSDNLAIDDKTVAKAVRYIRGHSRGVIQVEDVVQQVTVSRRALERRFRRVLKHSIFEEIRRARVQYISRILLETNTPISEIAFSLGYPSSEHISRYFKKETGLSPSEYRAKYGQG